MKKLGVLAVALLVVVAPACSGDDDDGAAPSDETSEAAPGDDEPGAGGEDAEGGDDGPDATAETGDDDAPPSGDPDSEFCRLAREFDEEFADNVGDGITDEELEGFEHLLSEAPDELEDSMQAALEYLRDLQEAGDDPEAQAEVASRGAELSADFEAMDTYFVDVCGIEAE